MMIYNVFSWSLQTRKPAKGLPLVPYLPALQNLHVLHCYVQQNLIPKVDVIQVMFSLLGDLTAWLIFQNGSLVTGAFN